jgi:hypothetical protein
MPATISATLAPASEAIGHAAAILGRLEAKAKADAFAQVPRGLVGRWTQARVSRVLSRLPKNDEGRF